MRKIVIPKRKLLGNVAFKRTMRSILNRPEVAKILNRPIEKRYFKSEMRKLADGGIRKEEERQMLAQMKFGEKDPINEKEANKLIRAFGFKTRQVQRKHMPDAPAGSQVGAHSKYVSSTWKHDTGSKKTISAPPIPSPSSAHISRRLH